MDVLLGSENFSEVFTRSEAASTIAAADQQLMKEQQEDMDLVAVKLDEQEENKESFKEVEHVTTTQLETIDKKKKLLKERNGFKRKEIIIRIRRYTTSFIRR